MIFIARDYKSRVISIISAKNQDSANAYWQGKGINPHTEETFDLASDRENEAKGWITPILETKELELKGWQHSDYHKYIVIT